MRAAAAAGIRGGSGTPPAGTRRDGRARRSTLQERHRDQVGQDGLKHSSVPPVTQ